MKAKPRKINGIRFKVCCAAMKHDAKKCHPLLSSKVSFIIFYSLHKIEFKICLKILFYNYQMFHLYISNYQSIYCLSRSVSNLVLTSLPNILFLNSIWIFVLIITKPNVVVIDICRRFT